MAKKAKVNEVLAKLATAHPHMAPYVSELLSDETGPAVFYPDVAVAGGEVQDRE